MERLYRNLFWFLAILIILLFSGCNLVIESVSLIQDMTSPEPQIMPTPDSRINAPVIYGPGLTNNMYPQWTWNSGTNGSGTFRYKLDDTNMDTGATTISEFYYIPPASLTEGSHMLYLQEQSVDGDWSVVVNAEAIVDYTPPNIFSGDNKTTGISFYTNAMANDTSGIANINWYLYSGPAAISFSDPSSLNTAITLFNDGWYTIELEVTDNAGNYNYDSFTLIYDTTAQLFLPFNANSKDESGLGRDANQVNSPILVPDRFGKPDSAFDVDTGYLSLPSSLQPDLSAAFTIAGWAQRYGSGSHTYQCFLGNNYAVNYSIGVNITTDKFYIKIGGGTYYFSDPADPIFPVDGLWHHFAVTFNDATDNLELYYDGVFIRSMLCTGVLNPAPGYDLLIGKDGYYSDSFAGQIDDIYIYDRVLNAGEINDLYIRP